MRSHPGRRRSPARPWRAVRLRIIHIMSCAPALCSGRGRPPWRRWQQCKPSANSNKAGRPCGLRLQGFMPARLRLSVTARSRSSLLVAVPASFRYPPRPVAAMHNALFPPLLRLRVPHSGPCGPRQPAPGRRFPGPQASCGPAQRRAEKG